MELNTKWGKGARTLKTHIYRHILEIFKRAKKGGGVGWRRDKEWEREMWEREGGWEGEKEEKIVREK